MAALTSLALALEQIRFAGEDELELQLKIQKVLEGLVAEGQLASFKREVRLTAQDRPDFMVCGSIAIEVKTQGSLNAVLRQLQRYAQHERVSSILLVTNKARLSQVPKMLSGKPVAVAVLRGWP
jgi:hypothetical protein